MKSFPFVLLASILLLLFPLSISEQASTISKEVTGVHEYAFEIVKGNVKIGVLHIYLNNSKVKYGLLIKGNNVEIDKLIISGRNSSIECGIGIVDARNVTIREVKFEGSINGSTFIYLYSPGGNIYISGSSAGYFSSPIKGQFSSSDLEFSAFIYSSQYSAGLSLTSILTKNEYAYVKRISISLKDVTFNISSSQEYAIFLYEVSPITFFLKGVNIWSKGPAICVMSSPISKFFIYNTTKIHSQVYAIATSNSLAEFFVPNPFEFTMHSKGVAIYKLTKPGEAPSPVGRNLIGLSNPIDAGIILALILVLNSIGIAISRIGKKY